LSPEATALGYAQAHDVSIEDRYQPAQVLAGKVIVISGIGPGLGLSLAVEAAIDQGRGRCRR
jgi:hypothetical protein